jgi:hypothetical protein
MNLTFSILQTWNLQATADKKNQVHPTGYFKIDNVKYQVQIDRGMGPFFL